MPFSSGVFTLVSGNPVVTGTTISSTVQNNTMTDVATGLSTCLLKDGTQTATATVPLAYGIDISAAGTGGSIKFPTTQVASSNAFTLDDYHEGTWTPIDSSGASLTFATAGGLYTKIGRLVYWQMSVTYPVTADGSAAVIGGLPFSANAGSAAVEGRSGCFVTQTNQTTGGTITGGALTISTQLQLWRAGTAATNNINSDMSGKLIYLAGFYTV